MDAAFRRVADASPAEIIDVDAGVSEREGVRSRLEKASSSDPPPDPDPSNIDLALPQLRLFRRDWVNGELSSKRLLEYVRAGKAQGAGGYDDLAAKGRKALTNAARDVMKFFGMPQKDVQIFHGAKSRQLGTGTVPDRSGPPELPIISAAGLSGPGPDRPRTRPERFLCILSIFINF